MFQAGGGNSFREGFARVVVDDEGGVDVARSPVFHIFVTSDIKKFNINIIVFDQGGLDIDMRYMHDVIMSMECLPFDVKCQCNGFHLTSNDNAMAFI